MGVCYGTPDFPTPSHTGYLKSGMKLTISSSSSSAASNSHDLLAAHDKKAFGDGEVLAHPSLTVFSFAELKKATKNFHGDALLGEGGFGYVYKGMLSGTQLSRTTKTIIAVKKLNPESYQGVREWQTEIRFLGSLSHPNLAKLLGYSHENNELALVYEFMPKGSLNNHLFRKGSTAHLSWDLRLKIVVGAARGLAFLHSSERKLIYRDFKTSNILLDGVYESLQSIFRLETESNPSLGSSAVLHGQTHGLWIGEVWSSRGRDTCLTRVMGTYGYACPAYVATGHLYVKSDVYGFGVVSLEILTGLTVIDRSRPKERQNLVEWVRPLLSSKRKLKTIMDSRLEGNYSIHSAFQIAQLAFKCLRGTPYKRPSMTEVVQELESIEAASANRIPQNA